MGNREAFYHSEKIERDTHSHTHTQMHTTTTTTTTTTTATTRTHTHTTHTHTNKRQTTNAWRRTKQAGKKFNERNNCTFPNNFFFFSFFLVVVFQWKSNMKGCQITEQPNCVFLSLHSQYWKKQHSLNPWNSTCQLPIHTPWAQQRAVAAYTWENNLLEKQATYKTSQKTVITWTSDILFLWTKEHSYSKQLACIIPHLLVNLATGKHCTNSAAFSKLWSDNVYLAWHKTIDSHSRFVFRERERQTDTERERERVCVCVCVVLFCFGFCFPFEHVCGNAD